MSASLVKHGQQNNTSAPDLPGQADCSDSVRPQPALRRLARFAFPRLSAPSSRSASVVGLKLSTRLLAFNGDLLRPHA